jgi:hypothetical protein
VAETQSSHNQQSKDNTALLPRSVRRAPVVPGSGQRYEGLVSAPGLLLDAYGLVAAYVYARVDMDQDTVRNLRDRKCMPT